MKETGNSSPAKMNTAFRDLSGLTETHRCTFRLLHDAGMSTYEIAEKYGCDRRTVSRLIRENREFDEIGKWQSGKKTLSEYTGLINEICRSDLSSYPSLFSFSTHVLSVLRDHGYTGSERTIRNHLRQIDEVRLYFQTSHKKGSLYVQSNKHEKPSGSNYPR